MPDLDQTQLDARRRRLCYRASHRGFLEMDVLLGHFADCHIDRFDEGQLQRFEALLELTDPELFAWYCRRQPVPDDQDNDILNLFMNFSIPS